MSIRSQPEKKAASHLVAYMKSKGWLLRKLSGGQYQQAGLPDYIAMHPLHGIRWIETKAGYNKLNAAQVKTCIEFSKYGQEVYVLKCWEDYELLFKKGNWREFARGF